MSYRTDKYVVGDVVAVDPDYVYGGGVLSKYGATEFKVVAVNNLNYSPNDGWADGDPEDFFSIYGDINYGQSNYDDVGHTQLLALENGPKEISGVFFLPIERG